MRVSGRNGLRQKRPDPLPTAQRPAHGSGEYSRPVSGPQAIGMGGRGGPKWAVLVGQWQKRVEQKAAGYPTNGRETCPWVG